LDEFLEFAINIGRKAGKLLMDFYNSREDLNISYKEDNSILTRADIASEKLIVEAIKKKFPSHSILAEEGDKLDMDSEYTWCIDPLDGTTNFSIHYPFFCVSIALFKKSEPIIGVIYFPSQDELYHAKKGGGSYLNERLIKVSSESAFNRAIVAFSNSRREQDIKLISKIFLELRLLKQKLRHFGSAALELAYTACGRISGFLSIGTNIWDIAAGMILIKEAGGKITTLSGKEYTLEDEGKIIIATNELIHENLLVFLNKIIQTTS
jgi:myo-inositol-1(or 4)-monophosphatase